MKIFYTDVNDHFFFLPIMNGIHPFIETLERERMQRRKSKWLLPFVIVRPFRHHILFCLYSSFQSYLRQKIK